jgi:uncharacterized iron-regulated membrane protein
VVNDFIFTPPIELVEQQNQPEAGSPPDLNIAGRTVSNSAPKAPEGGIQQPQFDANPFGVTASGKPSDDNDEEKEKIITFTAFSGKVEMNQKQNQYQMTENQMPNNPWLHYQTLPR